jgi:hypothetical protein
MGVVRLDTRESRRLGRGIGPRLLTTGHLVYAQPNGSLWASQFDADRLAVVGRPQQVLDGVRVEALTAVQLAIADTGRLAYVSGAGPSPAQSTLV